MERINAAWHTGITSAAYRCTPLMTSRQSIKRLPLIAADQATRADSGLQLLTWSGSSAGLPSPAPAGGLATR